MAISPLYIPLFTLEECMLDKDTGLPLSGGVVKFFRDSQRGTGKSVYQISGTDPTYTFTDVGNTFTLGINGTFVDINGNPFVPYALPYDAAGLIDLYHVTVESAGGVAQFTRDAVPYTGIGTVRPAERTNTENELSNPQFVEVLFPSSGAVTYSLTGTNTVTEIAPDWDLVTSGTGTVTLERVQPIAAGIQTNPPYTLSISASAGLGATVKLRQRLYNTPSILRGGFASGSLLAKVVSGGASTVTMNYVPSSGALTTIIQNKNIIADGQYHIIAANKQILDQPNSPADTGYVDIEIILPTSRNIEISSIQVVGVSYSIDIPFDEQSSGRQIDQLFHYYEDGAVHQPKKNILTGWQFGVNPWQFYSPVTANVGVNQYTADQTIVIQQRFVASGAGANIAVGRGTAAQNYGYLVTAVTAQNKFILLQYIDPATCRPYWGKNLSVMLKAQAILGAPHTVHQKFKVRLIKRAGLPQVTSQTVPVSGWANTDDDIPTLTGWDYITSVNDPTYTLTSNMTDFKFERFALPASTSDDMTLGIMIIMMTNMDIATNADKILFESVSLVNNDFAVEANAETFDESLRKCQYYWEQSFPFHYVYGVSAATDVGARNITQSATFDLATGNATLKPFSFNLYYQQVKRNSPSVRMYSVYQFNVRPLAVGNIIDNVSMAMITTAIAPVVPTVGNNPALAQTLGGAFPYEIRSVTSSNAQIVSIAPLTQFAAAVYVAGYESSIYFHYTLDARLGI